MGQSYETFLDELAARQQAEERLQGSLNSAADRNPEEVAGDIKLGQQTGVAPSLVPSARPTLQRKAFMDGIDLTSMIKQTSKSAEWLASDPNNAALATERPRGLMVLCPPSLAMQPGHAVDPMRLVYSPFSLPAPLPRLLCNGRIKIT